MSQVTDRCLQCPAQLPEGSRRRTCSPKCRKRLQRSTKRRQAAARRAARYPGLTGLALLNAIQADMLARWKLQGR